MLWKWRTFILLHFNTFTRTEYIINRRMVDEKWLFRSINQLKRKSDLGSRINVKNVNYKTFA